MKILVIDNETIALHSLRYTLKDYNYDIISYEKINPRILSKYDKVILSGGHAFTVLYRNTKYKKEMELIKKSKKPIFGICLGFQLICRTYGAHMSGLKKYEKGILSVKCIKKDPILKGVPKYFSVYENHRNVVKIVNKRLLPLAVSKDGVEIVKHASKNIYGTQFHPEKFVKKEVGRKILYSFLQNR